MDPICHHPLFSSFCVFAFLRQKKRKEKKNNDALSSGSLRSPKKKKSGRLDCLSDFFLGGGWGGGVRTQAKMND